MSLNVDSSQWRLVTAGGIRYKLLSRTGSFSQEDATATEEIIIESSNLLAFATECMPAPTVALGTIMYSQGRPLPGLPTLVVQSVNWEIFTDGRPIDPFGVDPDAPARTYDDFIKVTVQYGLRPQNDEEPDPNDPTTFLEISGNVCGEFLHTPTRNGFWTVGGENPDLELLRHGTEVVDVDLPKTEMVPQTEWTVRWPRVPYEYFTDTLVTKLRNAMGKVNSTPMELLYDAPAETILFLGYSREEEYTWREGYSGRSPVTVEAKFLEQNFEVGDGTHVTHNHFPRPGVGWRVLYVNDKKVYASTDLDALFRPSEE